MTLARAPVAVGVVELAAAGRRIIVKLETAKGLYCFYRPSPFALLTPFERVVVEAANGHFVLVESERLLKRVSRL